MKKEFSFYEFVGILVPGVTLLFFSEIIIELGYNKTIIDFSKFGESIVFLIIAYGVGHILQAVGNIFEILFWKIFGSMPLQWLTKKNRFVIKLFDLEQTEKIKTKIFQQFGEKSSKDYGRDVYNWLSLKEKVTNKRMEINACSTYNRNFVKL
jgi:hypothetical protein